MIERTLAVAPCSSHVRCTQSISLSPASCANQAFANEAEGKGHVKLREKVHAPSAAVAFDRQGGSLQLAPASPELIPCSTDREPSGAARSAAKRHLRPGCCGAQDASTIESRRP